MYSLRVDCYPEAMENGNDRERIVATCVECGAVYAAVELPNKGLRPIGRRDGCGSCGGTEFAPLAS